MFVLPGHIKYIESGNGRWSERKESKAFGWQGLTVIKTGGGWVEKGCY